MVLNQIKEHDYAIKLLSKVDGHSVSMGLKTYVTRSMSADADLARTLFEIVNGEPVKWPIESVTIHEAAVAKDVMAAFEGVSLEVEDEGVADDEVVPLEWIPAPSSVLVLVPIPDDKLTSAPIIPLADEPPKEGTLRKWMKPGMDPTLHGPAASSGHKAATDPPVSQWKSGLKHKASSARLEASLNGKKNKTAVETKATERADNSFGDTPRKTGEDVDTYIIRDGSGSASTKRSSSRMSSGSDDKTKEIKVPAPPPSWMRQAKKQKSDKPTDTDGSLDATASTKPEDPQPSIPTSTSKKDQKEAKEKFLEEEMNKDYPDGAMPPRRWFNTVLPIGIAREIWTNDMTPEGLRSMGRRLRGDFKEYR